MKLSSRSVVCLQSCDIIFQVISTTCCSCYMQCLGHEWIIIWGFPPSVYNLQIVVDICAVPMGYRSVAQWPLTWEDRLVTNVTFQQLTPGDFCSVVPLGSLWHVAKLSASERSPSVSVPGREWRPYFLPSFTYLGDTSDTSSSNSKVSVAKFPMITEYCLRFMKMFIKLEGCCIKTRFLISQLINFDSHWCFNHHR